MENLPVAFKQESDKLNSEISELDDDFTKI